MKSWRRGIHPQPLCHYAKTKIKFVHYRKVLGVSRKKKSFDEAKELLEAKTSEEILNELSDVLELVESIATNNKLTIAEVKKQKLAKKEKRGGFKKKLFLEYVDGA